ncbi:MAG: monovalent cation/H+ antiporter subunit D family protein [Deltaproteobacteria bacterium]|nr:monovalent cation/H+ antiporter subunit D family protein [Deltaproteobacteria bacterium]
MDTLWQLRPALILAITPLAAVLILLSGRRPNLREGWTLGAAFLQASLVLSMVPEVLEGGTFEVVLLPLASGFDLVLRTDPLGMVFACVSSILWVVTSFYSIGYMRAVEAPHQTGYFAAFAMCVGAATGLAFAGNPLTFFIFYEVLTISTYPLVVHKRTEEALKVGRKYLAYTLSAGLCLLLAVGWSQSLVGGEPFVAGGFLSTKVASPTTLTILFVLFMLGVGVKAGIMPLHAWLPAAMIAPTPVSALLHAVAVVKAGVFGTLRVVGYVFGPETLKELGVALPLATLAGFTIVTASVIALTQQNLKRRLAYSTISQLSYIVLGAALLTPTSMFGATMHIAGHAFMKITLFFCAGAIYAHCHVTEIRDLRGIGKAMPLTMGAFAVGAVGLAGIPPLPGFVSKWWLAGGAIEADQWIFLAVLVTSALLNILYFFPIIFDAFFRTSERYPKYDEAPLLLVGPPAFTAAACLLLGIAPDLGPHFWSFARQVMANFLLLGGGG